MNRVVLILAGFLFLWAGPGRDLVFAEGDVTSSFSAGVRAEYLDGNTTYHISEYVGSSGIESELEFPLKTLLAGVTLTYRLDHPAQNSHFHVDLSWMKNVGNGSGKVKDSDWMTNDIDIATVGSAHPGKDIYSESDMRLKADLVELRAVFNRDIGSKVSIGPMAGFKYQKFSYDISNVNQVGYGPYAPAYTASVPGLVATYEVTYDIFYVGISADFKSGNDFTATAQTAFAPLAQAKDRDDHILRSKLSTCTATGTAYFVSLGAQWNLSPVWKLGIIGEYLNISTEGTQHQYFYGGSLKGTTYDIADKITSSQLALAASITRRF